MATPKKRRVRKPAKTAPPRFGKALMGKVVDLFARGAQVNEIGATLNISRELTLRILRDPKVDKLVDDIRAERRKSLELQVEQVAVNAVRTIVKGMEGQLGERFESARERRLAAESILDRYGMTRKITLRGLNDDGTVKPVAMGNGLTLFDIARMTSPEPSQES